MPILLSWAHMELFIGNTGTVMSRMKGLSRATFRWVCGKLVQ
jgi:hypothetical protein